VRLRVYTDTSVIGGAEDSEFRGASRRLLEAFRRGDMSLVISELTLRELEPAPPGVRDALALIHPDLIEVLAVSQEAEELASAYIADGAVGARMRADALHIALASVARVDVLVSWNFKHIVNLTRIHAYHAVNLKRGYPILEIRTPREVVEDE
jgi:predicted nucleic acid-binding protein